MTEFEYIENAMSILQSLLARQDKSRILSEADEITLRQEAGHLFHEGITQDDAIKLLRCTEEASPDLEEEKALAQMRAIRAKYPPSNYRPRSQ